MRFNTFLSTLCLILVSSQVGEALSPSPSPAPAPAPGPGVGPYISPSGLQVGFYKGKCEVADIDVEAIIFAKIKQAFAKDATILPAFLRLQFHDCFVNGCDASLLLSGPSTEQTADPNSSVRGFDVIEDIKTAVEAECPGVVSCADITAVATAFLLQLSGVPLDVETGRRDGPSSNASSVDLPSPTMTVAEAAAFFALRNFTIQEMVLLIVGGHSVGITHCKVIQPQLDQSDPSFDKEMDPALLSVLRKRCPDSPKTPENTVLLNQDFTNNNTVDNSFCKQLTGNRGVLHLDGLLPKDPATSDLILSLSLNNTLFKVEFAKAMLKLQAFQVLTGDEGDIRNVCGKLN